MHEGLERVMIDKAQIEHNASAFGRIATNPPVTPRSLSLTAEP
jgi:hypothetical protein